ncbi:hypothetical protein [Methylophaga sp. OBS4]|uniref:hypothetical protein n=1 Tax=Methylophaga sp. OBS4 TaxID=2991935 RepID=UPI00225C354F|nr:hypothetical protein [Methylophaga sp. OBS4]MCX4188115.1 hypothetical protein [Methylophaga sp. OBS4]
MPQMKKLTALTILATGMSSFAIAPAAQAEDAFFDALTGGKASFSARVRYESVEQDNALKDADALTLRTTLGYKTGAFHGFSGFVEFEDVSDIGSANFNSTTNGEADHSVVADPDGTEVNQAYLAYNGFDTEVKFGRQEITYRDAPFHRFIGNVLWRQNHQSFDALSLSNTSLPDTKISYAYINKVHTIFGDDRDAAAAFIEDGDIDMDTHLFNIQYSGLPIGKLEGYTYLLDYTDAPDDNAASRATYGLRLSGAQAISDAAKVLYTAEYATQDDYADGEMDSQDYYLLELGGKYKNWLAKVSYEVQEGDGTFSFRTPLGTNHAFQGWADQFLNTPTQGLEDLYFTVAGNVFGAKLVAVYHDFETDESSLDAGNELDILLEKTFKEHYTVGVKYADYNADKEFPSLVDTEKFWVYGQVKF